MPGFLNAHGKKDGRTDGRTHARDQGFFCGALFCWSRLSSCCGFEGCFFCPLSLDPLFMAAAGRPGIPANGQHLGVTEPISIAGPTEMDCIKTRELEKVRERNRMARVFQGWLYICCVVIWRLCAILCLLGRFAFVRDPDAYSLYWVAICSMLELHWEF